MKQMGVGGKISGGPGAATVGLPRTYLRSESFFGHGLKT